jgi:hypothetical protein
MDRQELERVANAYLGALGADDWAQLQRILAPGVVFDEMTMQTQVEGQDAVVDAIRRIEEQGPPVEIAPPGWLVDEVNNVIAAELFVRRRHEANQTPTYATVFLSVTDDSQVGRIRTLYQVVAVDGGQVGPLCHD